MRTDTPVQDRDSGLSGSVVQRFGKQRSPFYRRLMLDPAPLPTCNLHHGIYTLQHP